MLLVRVKLFLAHAVTQDPNIGLLITAIVGVLVLLSSTAMGKVYKKRFLSILENTLIFEGLRSKVV